jgi:succinate dehydrogenase/fumarate reductase flavoprotein subunit
MGGYTANAQGERFIECDYWSGQMMQEFYDELQGGKGPVYLKLNHLAEDQPAYAQCAERIKSAYDRALLDGEKTRDLGGKLNTDEFAQAVIDRL